MCHAAEAEEDGKNKEKNNRKRNQALKHDYQYTT